MAETRPRRFAPAAIARSASAVDAMQQILIRKAVALSRASDDAASAALCTAPHAKDLGAEVRKQSSHERAVQVAVAEDAATAGADAALDQVDSPTALVAVGRDLGAAEELDPGHAQSYPVSVHSGHTARRIDSGMTPPASLPIDDVLPALLRQLAGRSAVVLQAPPGAGKTTRVPLAVLDAPWLADQRVVMLEP